MFVGAVSANLWWKNGAQSRSTSRDSEVTGNHDPLTTETEQAKAERDVTLVDRVHKLEVSVATIERKLNVVVLAVCSLNGRDFARETLEISAEAQARATLDKMSGLL